MRQVKLLILNQTLTHTLCLALTHLCFLVIKPYFHYFFNPILSKAFLKFLSFSKECLSNNCCFVKKISFLTKLVITNLDLLGGRSIYQKLLRRPGLAGVIVMTLKTHKGNFYE
jgi:hypothetical protein